MRTAATALMFLLLCGCSSQSDQDERLDYCKRLVLAEVDGDDGHGLNWDALTRVIYDKWKLSPKELVKSLDPEHKKALKAFGDPIYDGMLKKKTH